MTSNGFARFDVSALDRFVLPNSWRGAVVAIGNFDGVHLGHQSILRQARALCAPGQKLLVLTFEPHPRSVFRPQDPVFRLSPAEAKARLLCHYGADGVINWPFSTDFAKVSAEDFVRDILHTQIGADHVVVGYDFHFGQGRSGTSDYLAARGEELGFGVTIIPQLRGEAGLVHASSTIRTALAKGDVAAANQALGHAWFVSEEVIHGAKRGRDLGYPTANMQMAPGCRLAHGIYAVNVTRADGTCHHGVASYGRRPQFDNGAPLLETFLFDFSGDLYGEVLAVIFHAYLRPEMAFGDVDALISQMDQDSLEARRLLAGL